MISTGYEYLDVGGDVAFRAWADSLEELFSECAVAMYDAMVDVSKVDPTLERKLSVSAPSLELLLHRWLSELLFITDVEGLVFSKFSISVESREEQRLLEANAFGEPIDVGKHAVKTGLKAVTYHDLAVWRENGLWLASVILDV